MLEFCFHKLKSLTLNWNIERDAEITVRTRLIIRLKATKETAKEVSGNQVKCKLVCASGEAVLM